MRNTSKNIKIIGILICLFSFWFNTYDITRLIIMLLGLFLFVFGAIQNKDKIFKTVFSTLFLMIILFSIDVGLTFTNLRYPIFAKKVESSNKVVNYNSFLYTLYDCNGRKTFDFLYKQSNVCDSNLYEEKDINVLSSEIVSKFNKYKNKYFLINGKLSNKDGNNNIKLQPYTVSSDDSLNGNVVFSDNINFEIELKNNKFIDSYKLYNNIKLVGKIKGIKKNKDDIYTIYINNAYIVQINLYDDYKINVVEDNSCEKDKTLYETVDNTKYYTSCLKNIYVLYDEENVYELSYVLKDNKIDAINLIDGYKDVEVKENEDKTKYTLYKYDKYNILYCSDSEIIIGNSKLDFNNNYCTVKENDKNEL